jgi:hypothetical protein
MCNKTFWLIPTYRYSVSDPDRVFYINADPDPDADPAPDPGFDDQNVKKIYC